MMKFLLPEISEWLRVERFTTIKTRGGLAETLLTAVAVMPCKWPSCDVVITATLEATCLITVRNIPTSIGLIFSCFITDLPSFHRQEPP